MDRGRHRRHHHHHHLTVFYNTLKKKRLRYYVLTVATVYAIYRSFWGNGIAELGNNKLDIHPPPPTCVDLSSFFLGRRVRKQLSFAIKEKTEKKNNNTKFQIFVLIDERTGNPFHQLWSFVYPFDKLMRSLIYDYGIIPEDDISSIDVLLEPSLKWLGNLLKSYPFYSSQQQQQHQHAMTLKSTTTTNLPPPINIHFFGNINNISSMISSLDNTYPHHQQINNNNINNDNHLFCFKVVGSWNSFLGRHATWTPAKGLYIGADMVQWTERARKMIHPQLNSYDICHRQQPLLLFVDRHPECGISRTAFDLDTNKPLFQHIMPVVEKMGYQVEHIEVCKNLTQQVDAFSRANVIVSVHGAQITNLVYAQPCNNIKDGEFPTTLVEIGFRFGFCDHRIVSNGSRENLLEESKVCTKTIQEHDNRFFQRGIFHSNVYHKADFFRLATGLNIRYLEIINHALDGKLHWNPIGAERVIVNGTFLLSQLQRIKDDPKYDYKQLDYNGWEGVTPYAKIP